MKAEKWSFSVGTVARNAISEHGEKEDSYLEGAVATQHGYVLCYAQGSKTSQPHSRLDFVCRGRNYVWSFKVRYTKRGLARKAKEFAREIFTGSQV